jgi:hypothetical protein
MFLSTDLWQKPLMEKQSLRISKKILSYGSVSSRILETILLQNSLTNRLSSPRISPPLLLYYATDRDDSRPIEEPSLEPEIDPVPEPEPDYFDPWGLKPKNSKKSKKPSKSRLLRQSLDDKLYNIETIRTARCQVRQNSSPTEDYTTVFLGHAQLYVFAEK